MKESRTRTRRTFLVGLMSCIIMTAMVGIGLSGAYFSDTKTGAITGTIGSVKVNAGVNADTGGGLNFSFNNLLPGDSQSATVYFKNTGTSPEDIWLKFPTSTGLTALNQLGSYGTVAFTSSGGADWSSTNLGWPSIPEGGILIYQQLPVGATGSMTGTFGFTGELTDINLEGLTLPAVSYQIVATQVGQHP